MTARRHTVVAAVATVLATMPLAVIYEGWDWLLQSILAVAAVAGAAAAARAVRAPLAVQVLAMLVGLTAVLTALFSGGTSFAGVIPTRATLHHVGELLGELPAAVRENALPVPAHLDPLLLVTVGGVGLVALLVDVVTVGLRRPALAGLPMLAVYSVPVAVSFDAVPVLLFAVGACGYLWLLGSDHVDRVRRFGRRFTGDGRDVDAWEPSPLAAAGRRLALLGVLVAVVAPVAVPGMTTGLVDRFGAGLGGSGGTGGGGQVNLFAELYGQLNRDKTIDLVAVTTDDPDPFYLRLATADRITDTGFQPSGPDGVAVADTLPGPMAAAGSGVIYHRHHAQVRVTDDFRMYLAPTYAELAEVSGLGDSWEYDGQQQVVYSTGEVAAGASYEFTYLRPEYDAGMLRRAGPLPADDPIQEKFAEVPEIPEVSELLDELVDESAAPYDQVRDILAYFSRRNGFRYSLETGPETDAPAIVDFLRDKEGFCVQYATAMAWLSRAAGHPARVAFGFTRGVGRDDPRVLTNRNLHAWTEVYFDGFGWVPFDPTPSAQVTGSADPDWAPDPDAPPDRDPTDPQANPGGGASPGPSSGPAGGNRLDDGSSGDIGAPVESDPGPPWWTLGAGVLLVLSALPGLQRLRLRRHRLAGPRRATGAAGAPPAGSGVVTGADPTVMARHRTHLAWDELLDTMIDLRLPPDPTQTPRVTTQRLAEYVGGDAAALRGVRLLGTAEERARYARTMPRPEGLAEAVAAVRRGLAARSRPGARLRAALLPPSVLRRWRVAATGVVVRSSAALTRLGEWMARLSPRYLLRTMR